MLGLYGRLRGAKLTIQWIDSDVTYQDSFGAGDAPRLLGFLVDKAMRFAMLRLRLAIRAGGTQPVLEFYGETEDTEEIWWDVNPPTLEVMQAVMKHALAIAELDKKVPSTGRIRAMDGWRIVDLRVAVSEANEIIIGWEHLLGLPPPAGSR